MKILICMIVVILLSNRCCSGVKIGVSKIIPNITQTTTLTPEIHNTTQNSETTAIPSQPDESTVLTTTSTSTTTTTTTTTSTIKPQELPPTFPPKKSQPTVKRATTKPTISTITSTTSTESNLLDINNATSPYLHNSTIVLDASLDLPLHYFCPCDLHVTTCDINCCCDRDCSIEMLKVFNCNTPPKHPDLQTRLEDFHYNHGLPSCKVNDGWLCVFRTNLKPKKDKCLIVNLDTSSLKKWPQVSHFEDDQYQKHEDLSYYKFGQPLQLVDMETQTIQNIDLPTSFKSPNCQLMAPIRHLVTYQSNCLIETHDQLLENLSKLLNVTYNSRVLKAPRSQINDLNQDMKNLATIQICQKMKGNDSHCYSMDSLNISNELTDFGYESAIHIEFKILHNYTNIQGIIIEFDMEFLDDDDNMELWQHFNVNYIYRNATTESIDLIGSSIENQEARPISGPLGYIQGDPIIIAQLMPSDDDAAITVKHTLTYFESNASSNPLDYMLPLFTSRHGLCHKDPKISNVINYGINIAKSCNLRLNHGALHHQIKPVNGNYTSYCQSLQAAIMQQMLPSNVNSPEQLSTFFISQLGKPRPIQNEWLPLNVKNYEYATITGEFTEQTQTYTCRNIILSVAYELHVGEFMLQGEPHQRLVKHVDLVVGQRHDLEFEINELVELPLTMSVMFYDVQRNEASFCFSTKYSILFYSAIILHRFNRYF